MAEFTRPGTYHGIQNELQKAQQRVVRLALQREAQRQPGDPEFLTPREVKEALGPFISPRIEDYEKIIAAAHLLARERIQESLGRATPDSKNVQIHMETHLNRAILENALFRVPAIGPLGWNIRRRLQEFMYRARGRRGERLEIVGRGENKIGYLADQEALVRRHRERGQPYSVAVEKYGYPTDLVIRYRKISREPENNHNDPTWLVEVEPGGLKNVAAKIQVLHKALERRFYVSGAISARQARRVKTQLPEEATQLAIVFYTGTHPTLSEATSFFEDYQREHRISDLKKHLKNKAFSTYREYGSRVLARHDQPKILEQQLHEVLTDPRNQNVIRSSRYPVYWLAPIGDALFLINLKKAATLMQNRREEITHPLPYVPTPNRRKKGVSLHENLVLPDLDSLRRLGAMRYVASLRPATLH